MIEVKDLFFAFEETAVIQAASFRVEKGAFAALFGPNGGGKTTLCKLLAGLLKPQRGIIQVPQKVAYVPQNFAPDPLFPISVFEVVLMGRLKAAPRFFGYSRQDRTKAQEALQKVGLLERREAAFASLSGGQKQRVLLARALCSEPELLILDEATAHVDTASTRALLKLLKSLPLTILMVTHDLNAAIHYCDPLLCVQGSVTPMDAGAVCHHFANGLYHGVAL